MIDSIGDPILKANYIKQLQEKISTQNTTQNTNNPSTNQKDPVIPDFEENVMKLFSPKQRKVTIPDLQKEIKQVKEEIKDLKIATQKLQTQLQECSLKAKGKAPKQDNFKSSDDSEEEVQEESQSNHELASLLHPNLIQPQETSIIREIRIQKWYI